MSTGWKIFLLVLGAIVIGFVIFNQLWFSWFHGFIVALFYRYPHFLYSVIVAAVLSSIVYFIAKKRDWKIGSWEPIGYCGIAIWSFIILVTILLAVCSGYNVAYAQRYVAQNLQLNEIGKLPDTTQARILPRIVAKRYCKDALQYPKYQLGEADIVFIDNEATWTFPLTPDGFFNVFRLKGKGAIYARMDTQKKSTTIIEKEMKVGPGMEIRDHYIWHLSKGKFWRIYEDLYSVPYEDDLYFVVPFRKFKWCFRFPTVYTVPEFDGVALINSSGEIEFLSHEEALNHPVLKGQLIFSEYMTRYQINSLRYALGINNKLFKHHDQLEIADLEIVREEGEEFVILEDNEQPFLVKTEDGLKRLIAAEPYGKAHGIFKIFLTDARTGKIDYFKQPATETLIGPVRACDYVRKANPRVSWGTMRPTEPIPIIQDGILYWEVRVIPDNAAGVSYTTFVNSIDGDVIQFEKDEDIKAFIKGYELAPVKTDTEEKKVDKEEKGYITIIIISPDGTRKEIKLEKGSKLIIQ